MIGVDLPMQTLGISGGAGQQETEWAFADLTSRIKDIGIDRSRGNWESMRLFASDVEDASGLAVFTRGVDQIDIGLQAADAQYVPSGLNIRRIFKDLSTTEREEIGTFLARFGDGRSTDMIRGLDELAEARAAGLSEKQVTALSEMRFQMDGRCDPNRNL